MPFLVLYSHYFDLINPSNSPDPLLTYQKLSSFFSYFTNLGYIGICAYFFASGAQTLIYARNLRTSGHAEEVKYPLQTAPRFLRYLYVLLLSTVITFRELFSCFLVPETCSLTWLPRPAILVTVVYWTLIASSATFSSPYASQCPDFSLLNHSVNTDDSGII